MDGNHLGSYLKGRNNNLNFIRMLAATSVLVSHAYPMTLGPDAVQPLQNQLGITLGHLAVYVFFILSGFLITSSMERRTIDEFVLARILRLFPGLLIVLLLTIFILGPLTTRLPLGEYVSSFATFTYVPRNITLAILQYDLPGVFKDNPYPSAINGSLWSLFPEVVCYMGVVALGLSGLLASVQRFLIAIGLYLLLYALSTQLPASLPSYERIQILIQMSFPFFVGITFYKLRDFIPLNLIAALICFVGMVFLNDVGFSAEVFSILCGYLVIYLAYVPGGFIRNYNRFGDYSYGTYIYAFPAQQAAVFWYGPMDPVTNIMIAGCVTILLAICSWHLVEKPALASRHNVASRLRHIFSASI